ncbi:response regulator [Tepidibacillus decaturensis]|uniref:response regulator n=1 Tax=Tepidibacillus decaturensis TaxID=1413211 RepID=UPI0009E93801|nr:response regulator [Tepidibacillus decaturensis]
MSNNTLKKKKKILLVEDSRLTALVVAEFLNKNGYDVEIVTSGEKAVQKISGGFLPDLVLMDIELAGEIFRINTGRQLKNQVHHCPEQNAISVAQTKPWTETNRLTAKSNCQVQSGILGGSRWEKISFFIMLLMLLGTKK